MARCTAAALILASAVLASAAPVRAQALQRLTVETFALSADTNGPVVDVPFHLVVALRVRENAARVANINLPILAQLELLGDERQTAAGPGGTQYRETITVVAHQPGAIAIAPATLQAVDARDGKPKQWYTNGLTLTVRANGAQQLHAGERSIASAAVLALRAMLWLFGIGCAGALGLLLFRRRRPARPVQPAPAPDPPPEAPEPAPGRDLEDALALLRAERTRDAAVRARSAVWRMVGAADGETLADVLARTHGAGDDLRDLLVALERSAFTYDADLQSAVDASIAALERRLGGMP